jgi:hypothetical protein
LSYKTESIEGIGPTTVKKLARANIKTTDDLLSFCCDKKGRKYAQNKPVVRQAVTQMG